MCIYNSAWGQKELTQVVDSLSQDTLNYKSMYMAGKILENSGRHSRALPLFERADRLASSDSTKFRLAYNLYHSGYYKRCIEISKDIISRDSVSVEKLTLLSAGYEKIMARDSAAQVQMAIMRLEPDNSSALISMCKNLISLDEQMPRAERVDTALYFLRAYREIDTLNLFVNELYGRKLFFKKEYEQSLGEYKKLKSLGDVRTNINYYLAQNYAYLDSIPQACNAYDALLEQTKGTGAGILMKYGLLCSSNSMDEEAIALISEAWKQSEMSTTVKSLMTKTLAKCFYNTNNYENSIDMALKAYEIDNDNYETAVILANSYYRLGMVKEEKQWIERLLEIKQSSDDKRLSLIRTDWYEGRLKEIKETAFMKGELAK